MFPIRSECTDVRSFARIHGRRGAINRMRPHLPRMGNSSSPRGVSRAIPGICKYLWRDRKRNGYTKPSTSETERMEPKYPFRLCARKRNPGVGVPVLQDSFCRALPSIRVSRKSRRLSSPMSAPGMEWHGNARMCNKRRHRQQDSEE